ncbi:hypothetical protein CF319_g9269 [Tilletia indica]|nr:hypothetical protein CF319_g9269 [Tilletia indica]
MDFTHCFLRCVSQRCSLLPQESFSVPSEPMSFRPPMLIVNTGNNGEVKMVHDSESTNPTPDLSPWPIIKTSFASTHTHSQDMIMVNTSNAKEVNMASDSESQHRP